MREVELERLKESWTEAGELRMGPHVDLNPPSASSSKLPLVYTQLFRMEDWQNYNLS